jgi:hypothetical protein
MLVAEASARGPAAGCTDKTGLQPEISICRAADGARVDV